MKKYLVLITALVFIINVHTSKAADLTGKWAVDISGGLGVTLGPEEASDYFHTSFVLSGDLSYMMTANIGIVPLSMHYHKFSFDNNKLAADLGIPRSAMDEIDTSVWALGYTPGILFISSGERKVRGFGQIGAGLYHFKGTVEAPIIDYKEDFSKNNFGMLFGGGIEVDISKSAAIVGKARFHWIKGEDESTTVFDFAGGIKFYLGD